MTRVQVPWEGAVLEMDGRIADLLAERFDCIANGSGVDYEVLVTVQIPVRVRRPDCAAAARWDAFGRVRGILRRARETKAASLRMSEMVPRYHDSAIVNSLPARPLFLLLPAPMGPAAEPPPHDLALLRSRVRLAAEEVESAEREARRCRGWDTIRSISRANREWAAAVAALDAAGASLESAAPEVVGEAP